jgi:type 1 fimbriae regulatory protein FimB/type 1 fimbriae regulatory protein FimE
MMLEFTVGINIAGKHESVSVAAEDALIAALKVKCERPDALINYVRRRNKRGDLRHPHGSIAGKALRRENLQSRFVFNTERGGPVTRAWFLKMVRRTGELAKLPLPVHPHMLRHGCGFKLANDGVDTRALQHFLGHRNIIHTVRYTELRSDRFDGFWKD